jgi:DNA-binding MarR family transcriptional regulator
LAAGGGEHVDAGLLRALGDQVLRLTGRRATTYPGSVLDTSAFRILWRLEEAGPRTLRDLADELQLEQSTVNRQVNGAIRHGLVERFEVEDQVSRLLRPTARGREAYEHDGRLRADVFSEALADLGADRARALVDDLAALNDALDRAHARTTQPR